MQYVLYVRIGEGWVETDRFLASDNVDAFHKAVKILDPDYRGLPIAFARADSANRESGEEEPHETAARVPA